jgi:PAS domain S-box-containing protein
MEHAPKSGKASRLPGLSLRAKGVATLAVPLGALYVALFATLWTQGPRNSTEVELARADYAQLEVLQAQLALARLRHAISERLMDEGAQSLDYRNALAESNRSLERAAAALAGDAAGLTQLHEVGAHVAEISRFVGSLAITKWEPRDLAPARATVDRLGDGIDRDLSTLRAQRMQRMLRAGQARETTRRGLFRVLMICGVLGALGSMLVQMVIFGRVSRRLREVEDNARRLAHGLPLEPFSSGKDEISALAAQVEETAFLLHDRERELRESEERYRDLFNQAPIPYEETDREGRLQRFNQAVCDLLRCGADRVLGSFAWDFAAPDQREKMRDSILGRIAAGEDAPTPYECDFLLEDGSCLRVEIRESVIRGEKGQVTGVCCSLLDVTERNLAAVAARKVEQYALELRNKNEQISRALAAARSATEAKSRFLAAVSHELRTPLNGIIGFSEVMYDGKAGPVSEIHQEFLGDILTSARHLLQLINDVLDLSKVEAGRMEFRPEPCLVRTLVAEVCDIVSPLADKKHVVLTTDVPADLSAVIDHSRFKQVLYNYLSNAVKFTPENGRVAVRVAPQEGAFRLDVEDTGVGISPEELPLLFKEFQQVTSGRKANAGTGLGLALTRHIVEAQGGRVSVESVLGKGSIFSAVLPLSTSGNGTGSTK